MSVIAQEVQPMNNYETQLETIRKINAVHHKLIAHELPLVDQLTTMMLRTELEDSSDLRQIRHLFVKLFTLLPAHLNHEAKIVYPSMLRQAQNESSIGETLEKISEMHAEHDQLLDLFRQLRQLTQHYRADPKASDEVRLAFDKLKAIDEAATELIRFESEHAYKNFLN